MARAQRWPVTLVYVFFLVVLFLIGFRLTIIPLLENVQITERMAWLESNILAYKLLTNDNCLALKDEPGVVSPQSILNYLNNPSNCHSKIVNVQIYTDIGGASTQPGKLPYVISLPAIDTQGRLHKVVLYFNYTQ